MKDERPACVCDNGSVWRKRGLQPLETNHSDFLEDIAEEKVAESLKEISFERIAVFGLSFNLLKKVKIPSPAAIP
jgi:hypothetical protein